MKKQSTLSAQVILKDTIAKKREGETTLTHKNISEHLPQKSKLEQTARILKRAGFRTMISPTTISITGSPDIFKKYFTINSPDNLLTENNFTDVTIEVPGELKSLVEMIVPSRKAELF